MENDVSNNNKYLPLIIGGSVLIPIIVTILYYAPAWKVDVDFSFLPPFYASINGLTAIVLMLGLREIKKGNIKGHKRFMSAAIVLSIVFLLSYVLYHLTSESTKFGGEGFIKYMYYFILLSHILLSVAIVPMVLITYTRALSERFDKHKNIAKWTLPLWLYVAITGVIVYLMIAPYYT